MGADKRVFGVNGQRVTGQIQRRFAIVRYVLVVGVGNVVPHDNRLAGAVLGTGIDLEFKADFFAILKGIIDFVPPGAPEDNHIACAVSLRPSACQSQLWSVAAYFPVRANAVLAAPARIAARGVIHALCVTVFIDKEFHRIAGMIRLGRSGRGHSRIGYIHIYIEAVLIPQRLGLAGGNGGRSIPRGVAGVYFNDVVDFQR